MKSFNRSGIYLAVMSAMLPGAALAADATDVGTISVKGQSLPQNGDELAGVHGQRHVAQHGGGALVFADKRLVQPAGADNYLLSQHVVPP